MLIIQGSHGGTVFLQTNGTGAAALLERNRCASTFKIMYHDWINFL